MVQPAEQLGFLAEAVGEGRIAQELDDDTLIGEVDVETMVDFREPAALDMPTDAEPSTKHGPDFPKWIIAALRHAGHSLPVRVRQRPPSELIPVV